jgi:phosphoglucosamine mutase
MKNVKLLLPLLLSTIMFTLENHTFDRTTASHRPQNMFGTDGIRATVGQSPLTQSELYQMGYALGTWIVTTYGPYATTLLGHDTRLSCSWVKSSLKSGLLAHPINLIDAEVLPTPAVVQLTLTHDIIACGIIISASHNPFQDNGIKIIDGSRGKLSAEDEKRITDLFYTQTPEINFAMLGQEQHWSKAAEIYCNHIAQFFRPGFLKGKKIVLDCAHGATYRVAPSLFIHFGAEVIYINTDPTGTNINDHCGATDVEQLKDKVLAEHADAGFAFDGDGDRVIAVNNKGEVKDGDEILAVLLDHEIYKNTKAVVGTIMTNKGFENWLAQKQYPLIRTPVGDKYIARAMEKEGGQFIIGGEQSGHIILYDYLPTGDGIFTALRVMETLINVHNTEMKSFEHMPQFLINVPVTDKKDLTQEPFASIIKQKEDILPNGRIIVRFSGTEAKLRVMVEDHNEQLALEVGRQLAQELQMALGA